MAKEKKKSKFGSHLASISFFTLMGMVLGFAMISFLEWQLPEGIESSEKAYRIFAMLVFLYLSCFIHIAINTGTNSRLTSRFITEPPIL